MLNDAIINITIQCYSTNSPLRGGVKNTTLQPRDMTCTVSRSVLIVLVKYWNVAQWNAKKLQKKLPTEDSKTEVAT